MTRSIHTTRRTYKEVWRQDWSAPERKRERLREIIDEIEHKRACKRNGRKGSDYKMPTPGLPAEPRVEVEPLPEMALHAASEADVRAILKRFPAAMVAGIAKIQLLLGRDVQAENAADEERDPYLGRAGIRLAPGIYAGRILGRHMPASHILQIFAFARHPEIPDRQKWETLLRLMALSTLVHEIAHHHDRWTNPSRKRATRPSSGERYADNLMGKWTRDVVLPDLRERYPQEMGSLEEWVVEKTGVRVPLELLACNLRLDEKGKFKRVFLGGLSEGFLNLLQRGQRDLRRARLDFAHKAHCGDCDTVALEVLETLLREDAADSDALVLKAHVLLNMGESHEAESILAPLASLPRSPAHVREDLLACLLRNQKHVEALRLSQDILDEFHAGNQKCEAWPQRDVQECRVALLLALKRTEEIPSLLESLGRGSRLGKRNAQAWRILLLVEAKSFGEARGQIQKLSPGLPPWEGKVRAMLRIAEFLVRKHTGRNAGALRPGEPETAFLRNHGLQEWFTRAQLS